MSTYSKRIKINPNILLEYTFDDTNFKSEDYKVITNLKEKSKGYLSETTINNLNNNLFMVDPILSKYSPIDTDSFNFLKVQDYFTSPILNDKLKIYFPSGFQFTSNESIGFFINVYTYGQGTNTKYSLTNFYYVISNTDVINLFTLPTPFYFDEKFWTTSIDLEFPSIHSISQDRVSLSRGVSIVKPDTINEKLTYTEGLSTNDPIFIDFAFITSYQSVMDVPYYYTGDIYSVSLPQTPEFTELGINITESTQGDYYEIYSTYLGSNENMDEFAYSQEVAGIQIQLQYIVNLYEENILTTTQTYQVSEDFTKKILYRPVIQFSNTTAAIDVELRVVNLVDNSYISKYGSVGITNSLNKYGLKLTRLNMDSGVINAKIFNMKVRNSMTGGSSVNSFVDVMKVPYPVMIDRYRILTKTSNSSPSTNDYVSNGLLEILITPFDNVIEFNIAQDINSSGEPIPYDLSSVSTNSNLRLVFKSSSEKLEKEPFYEADNNYELGKISYKIQEKDYNIIRRIYGKGYDNFYLVVNASGINTQLYSGKFLFYEDVTFVKDNINSPTAAETSTSSELMTDNTSTNTTNIDAPDTKIDSVITNNNPFVKDNMPVYVEDPNSDKNYINLIIYVRFQTNIDKMDSYLLNLGITPGIKYGNMYFLRRVYFTTVADIKSQDFIEKVFPVPLLTGTVPKEVKTDLNANENLRIYKIPPVEPTQPPAQPYAPHKPQIYIDRATMGDIYSDGRTDRNERLS